MDTDITTWHWISNPWLLGLAFFLQLVIVVLLVRAVLKLREINTLIREKQAEWMELLRDTRKKARLAVEASYGAGEELRLAMRNYPFALKVILWLTCRKPASS